MSAATRFRHRAIIKKGQRASMRACEQSVAVAPAHIASPGPLEVALPPSAPPTLLHVGGHHAEEARGYAERGFDGRVVFNAVYYTMKWNDMQIEVVDPSNALGTFSVQDDNGDPLYGNIPFQIVVGNVGNATVKGFDFELKALVTENLEVGVNLTDIQDAYVDGQEFYDEPRAQGGKVPSGLQPRSNLPLFADTSYYLYADYSGINIFGGEAGIRLQHSYVGDSLNQLTDGFTSPQRVQGDYDITDAILSFESGDWQAQLRFSNLTDERGITYQDTTDFDTVWGRNSSSVIRPRNYSLTVRKAF